jgi:hypothetical protein
MSLWGGGGKETKKIPRGGPGDFVKLYLKIILLPKHA